MGCWGATFFLPVFEQDRVDVRIVVDGHCSFKIARKSLDMGVISPCVDREFVGLQFACTKGLIKGVLQDRVILNELVEPIKGVACSGWVVGWCDAESHKATCLHLLAKPCDLVFGGKKPRFHLAFAHNKMPPSG